MSKPPAGGGREGRAAQQMADIKERIGAVRRKGSVWLEPLEEFIGTANAAEKIAFSGSLSDLRDFHRKIGSNLLLHAPVSPRRAEEEHTRPSKERAGTNPDPDGGDLSRRSLTKTEAAARECAASEIRNRAAGNPSPIADDRPLRSSPMAGPESSSRYAENEIPVLRVEYPKPWNLIAKSASSADKNRDRLKWSGR
ncbi:MAG: hypothetical protein JXQ75_24020 [Phycisphaerae bacterium]|nr:hypothetical protein [Phycisphaerae bacterium]